LTRSTRPRFAATSFEDFAIPTTSSLCAHVRRACVGNQAECAEHGAGPCAWSKIIGHWLVLGFERRRE
jgi:hypothetical protein